MSARKNRLGNLSGTLPGFAIVCLALWLIAGCRTDGTVDWKEDRGIPFSPDDRAIAYRHRGAVYVARTQGDKHRRIYEARPDWSLSTPHWAPGQRAVIFAVADGSRDSESGLLNYTLYHWPAPQDIWTSNVERAKGDSAKLPTNWTPARPQLLTSARCRAEMQVRADALFKWHPDGKHVLFLDTDETGLQTVLSLDVDTGTRTVASPVRAASHAFSISPSGEHLVTATRDPDADALWLGPIGADMTRWRMIEQYPAPPVVPKHLVTDSGRGRSVALYDLRPRLGMWSADSRWLAHIRTPPEKQSSTSDQKRENLTRELVLTRVGSDKPQQVLSMPRGRTADLHWAPNDRKLGLLSDSILLLVDSDSGAVTELSGTLQVESFIGWSTPGSHLAYLTPAEEFDAESAIVPIGWIRWRPAARHNLMIAQPDGTLPENRFGLMNVSDARWSNQSTKLSFWATHLPTVSHLPRGDPAAVLDLDEDAIRWFPTDVAEYSQVGHYYLLNREYEQAIEFYTDALEHITDDSKNRVLVARIRMWRGISSLAAGDPVEAGDDLSYFREHILPPDIEIPEGGWDEAVVRGLSVDRIFLSTLLSMGQIRLAVDEAARIAEQHEDAQQIQALCFLALIDRSIGQRELYTDGVLTQLVPRAMRSQQIPRERIDRLVTIYLRDALHPRNQRILSDRSKKRLAERLMELAETLREAQPADAVRLTEAAAILYRESGEMAMETDVLKSTPEM